VASTPKIEQNVRFLGERAREIVDQEVDRARGLDTKAAGLIAASLAGLVGGITFAAKLSELHGGTGAKTLWAVSLVLGLVLLIPALGLAVRAILPQAFRIAVAVEEMRRWVTPRFLGQEPTDVEGELLYGSVIATGDARAINEAKAERLSKAFYCFAAALLCVVMCGSAVAIHAALYPERDASSQGKLVSASRVGDAER
jgi:hypothetical protein